MRSEINWKFLFFSSESWTSPSRRAGPSRYWKVGSWAAATRSVTTNSPAAHVRFGHVDLPKMTTEWHSVGQGVKTSACLSHWEAPKSSEILPCPGSQTSFRCELNCWPLQRRNCKHISKAGTWQQLYEAIGQNTSLRILPILFFSNSKSLPWPFFLSFLQWLSNAMVTQQPIQEPVPTSPQVWLQAASAYQKYTTYKYTYAKSTYINAA